MSENRLFLSGEENEKVIGIHAQIRITTKRQSLLGDHLLPMPVKFGRRPFPRSSVILFTNDRTNERMTENDHITSALLAEVIIIIIICYRPSDRVKIDRQYIFN